MAESTEAWPMGLRFKPTEDELVSHYLTKKLRGGTETICVIPELYIYNWEPPDLFILYDALSSIPSDGRECFFFCPRGCNRKTACGFWKETSTKRVIQAPDTGKTIGIKRILVYYEGRQPKGRKTDVAMHQYNLDSNVSDSDISDPTALVVCRMINRKSKKAKSATASTSTDLSGPSSLNDSQNEDTQEISTQASPGVTVEVPYRNETSTFNLPDQNVPIPDQQPQTSKEQQLSRDDHWQVDEPSDRHCPMPNSPSDCMDLTDLFNYDESTD
ncbi:protein NTM1-like 9 [Syzygium oleosum]|uniref:protein NTM1-like 9 n=1 Tax=Syzygium oleosum TaxID=219896 RepID=UPI0024B94252|nr:protein NTM1-like 9 [Syzygium oleosum]XP_056159483.1 protein NTM1-like 9 [Syzygium oleosum]XP_056159484.1 protein NTM1-like 9 [Syzygium oleosum]XP_056159485.1 protein NTM1-like 9 [Syzygium oleosum]